MLTSATRIAFALGLCAVCAWAQPAWAQDAPELGDEFIFFVDGVNVLIPATSSGVTVVDDPLAPGTGDKVARVAYGNWAHSGFEWERTSGVNASANVGADVGDGDTLYLSLLSDPANLGQPGVWLMFTDKTDDSGASRADLEAGTATADHEFRAIWTIPQELHDGQWHDLAIPLPPATQAALEAARDAGTLDDMAQHWSYPGAWTNGAFGIGPGFGTSTDDPLWREFEWDAVKNFGVMFDNSSGGGPLYIDNMYIGGPGTDISAATEMPAAMSGVSFQGAGETNVISWTHDDQYGGYNVYVSAEPIVDPAAEGVMLLQTVPFNAADFSVEHSFEVPHPSLAPMPLYYAVTSLNQFGTENPDVSGSSQEIANDDLPISAYITQLTADEADMLFNNLSAGIVSSEGFPEGLAPFELINPGHMKLGDSPTPELPEPSDLSAKVWMGYSDMNELFVYAEITDEAHVFGGENAVGSDTWQFDSMEIGIGNYDVRLIDGGGILVGTPHEDMQRGDEADYQFRLAPLVDAGGDIVRTSTYVGWSQDAELQGGGTIAEPMEDAGVVVGYKLLALIPLDAIQNVDEGDAVLPPPGPAELRLIPFNLALNDADVPNAGGGPPRETQVQWSTRPSAGAQWWNTPAQWAVVAMAGRDLSIDVEPVGGEVPGAFALEANYPNPFNPTTTIGFALPTAERVTLAVYDLLGRRVAVLVDGDVLGAGAYQVGFDASGLASGVYLYRLTAGNRVVDTRRMVLLK